MPLLGGLFHKRDRQNSSTRNVVQSTATGSVASFASTRDSTDADYVFPDKSLPPPPPIYNLPAAASSSKLKLPFRRKPVPQPDPKDTPQSVVCLNDAPSPPHPSSVTSDSGHGLPSPPPRASIFGVYNESAQSTHSLPNESSNHHFDTPSRPSSFDVRSETHSTPSSHPVSSHKKSAGLFSWARERTKSKPPFPDSTASSAASANTSAENSSFNLKAFRHVRAESPVPSPEKPVSSLSSSSLAPPQPRPRGNSAASDSSQRISVAAFREAQARRANSPVPSFRPPSTTDTLRLDVTGRKRASTVSVVTPDRPQLNSTPSSISGSRPGNSALQMSSSDESESEDDEDVDSDGEPIPKPARKRTITRVDASRARSDAGHSSAHSSANDVAQTRAEAPRLPKAESTLKNQLDLPPTTRQRASVSTSALTPTAAARRASILAAANSSLGLPAQPKLSARKHKDDDSESSDSSDSDSETLPLSGLIPPRRPGSSASNQSAGRPRVPAKPLIDINSLVGRQPLLTPILRHEHSVKNLNGRDAEKDEPFSVPAALLSSSPSPTISPAHSPANKQSIPPVNKPTAPSHQRGPSSELPTLPKPKAADNDDDLMNAIRLVSSLDKALDKPSRASQPSESQSKPAFDRIVPTPIREREPPTSFTVLSRPVHRQSTAETSASLSPASQSQFPSVSSPPIVSAQSAIGARQRASTTVGPPPQKDKSDTISVVSTAQSSTSRTSSRVPPVPLIHSIPDSPSVKEDWKTGGRPRSASRGPAYNPPERHSHLPPMPTSTSSNMLSSGIQPSLMPQRPFASNSSLRGESPAGSSTGDSSSGRAPFTPRDGSDIGVRSRDDGSDVGSTLKARGHAKKPSVTFEDEQPFRGRERAKMDLTSEERTRERRRSEAKAAIELGKIVNGHGPLHDSDDDLGLGARNPAINVTPVGMENSVPGMAAPGWAPWQQPMATGMGPMVAPQFSNDPAFLAAHHRALLMAKQAYQMAVAQQAMQMAGEEWERSSNIGFSSAGSVYGGGGGSVYGGGSGGSVYGGGGGSVYGGGGGGSVYGGVGGGMAPMGMMGMPGMGMLMPPNQWSRSSVMFPGATASVYGGISSSQSEFGGGGGWGSRSAYGDSFGASSRSSYMSTGVPNSSASAYGGGSRPRARTGVTPPSGSAGQQMRTPGKSSAVKPPPSSWKNGR